MKDFIEALSKRSSITCVTREQYGRIDVEFAEKDLADAFMDHCYLLQELAYVLIGNNETALELPNLLKKQRQALYNEIEVIKKITEMDVPQVRQIALVPLPFADEDQSLQWRWRLSWDFESGPKATELFQRLQWLLEEGKPHELATA